MLHDNYKTKVEYGVSATVILVGLFFIYQASTIGTSKEMFGPNAMPFALSISTVLGGVWLAHRAFRGKVGAVGRGRRMGHNGALAIQKIAQHRHIARRGGHASPRTLPKT